MRTSLNPTDTTGDGDVPGIAFRSDGDVLTVTLARPPGNELSAAMFDAFEAVLRREAQAPTARVLVLRAEGEAFCTGRDRAAMTLAETQHEAGRIIALKRALRATPLISVARVHAKAFGFGVGLAMLSDFAIAAEDAPFAFPEMRAGLPPAAILSYISEYALPRHAFPLVLFGETFSAAHAQAIGLINTVVPASALDATVDALVARILALPAASARACKELFQTMLAGSFETNARLAADALAIASVTLLRRPADAPNGVK